MTVQINVGLEQAIGLPGQKATPDQFIYPAVMPVSKGVVTCGNFVWLEADGRFATGAGTAQPLGIVERVIQYFDYDGRSPGTLEIQDNMTLTVGIRGDYWVETTTAATPGQTVYARQADGAIVTGDGTSVISGATVTAWKVLTAGAAGDMIKISNWEKGV